MDRIVIYDSTSTPKTSFFYDRWKETQNIKIPFLEIPSCANLEVIKDHIDSFIDEYYLRMGEELEMNMQPTIFIRGNDGQFAEIGGIEKTEVTAGKCAENPFKKEIHLTIGKLSIDDEIALLELAFGNGRIRRFVSRLGGEWRDKLYKNYE